jgi:mRNA interferase RelE/StbE
VEKELAALPDHLLSRAVARIQSLSGNPWPRGVKKLEGGSGYRIRVGDYRILYDVDSARRVITVFAVGHRRDIYRR